MDDYTAYVNPYFVVQKGRFTKHYFEGSSRIVSKLGEGTFHHPNRGISAGGIDYIRQSAQMQEARDRYIKGSLTPPGPPTQHGIYASPEWTGQPYPSLGWQNIRQDQEPPEGWPRPPKFNEPGDVPGPPVQYGDPITPQTVKAGYGFIDNGIIEKNLYFYHPDHLGSSSYITDREGRITQHTEYIAFGEVLFEEHSTSRTMPYLFNGKELDTETGLYYYGARYYDAKTSIFLNVDPLVEKTMTPYAYTNNNPINLIDPTGMESEKVDDIIIKGKNQSSITIKTDLINIEFNTNNDYKGNHVLDASNIAIGYQYSGNATATAGIGTSYSVSKISTLFLGGDYAGYWYDYLGAEGQIVATSSAEASLGIQKSWFIAVNNDKNTNNPKSFAGHYYGGNASISYKPLLGGVNLDLQYSISEDKTWKTYSIGVSGSIGPQIGVFEGGSVTVGGHLGTTKLINNVKRTKDRSTIDIVKNWVIHFLGQ